VTLELESLAGPRGRVVKGDDHCKADRTLSADAELAHERGRIVT
jgi:hypothetical protein